MDWASQHARIRGATFWKAFTTGKSQSLGGIPHDLFGMTTRSVHQYVVGIYKKLGLKVDLYAFFDPNIVVSHMVCMIGRGMYQVSNGWT